MNKEAQDDNVIERTTLPEDTPVVKKLIGFAALTPEKRREIARAGQAALAAAGKRYTWNTETAKEAARVGWARRNANRP